MTDFENLVRDIESRFRVLSQELSKESATLSQSVAETLREFTNQAVREIGEIRSNLEHRQTLFETTHGEYYTRYAQEVCTTLRSLTEELTMKFDFAEKRYGVTSEHTSEEIKKIQRDIKQLQNTVIGTTNGVNGFSSRVENENHVITLTLSNGEKHEVKIPVPDDVEIEVDTELSDTSTNPIANASVTAKFNDVENQIANIESIIPTGGWKTVLPLTDAWISTDDGYGLEYAPVLPISNGTKCRVTWGDDVVEVSAIESIFGETTVYFLGDPIDPDSFTLESASIDDVKTFWVFYIPGAGFMGFNAETGALRAKPMQIDVESPGFVVQSDLDGINESIVELREADNDINDDLAELRARVDEIPTETPVDPSVFVATYGVTTYDEIYEAVQKNKFVVVHHLNSYCHISTYPLNNTEFIDFLGVFYGGYTTVLRVQSDNTWKTMNYTIIDTLGLQSTINENSTHQKAPSSLAVYNAIQSVMGSYVNDIANLIGGDAVGNS